MSVPSPNDVRAFVIDYLSKRTHKGDLDGMQINDDAFDFFQAGILDSVGVIEMIAAMERHFQIAVDFEFMEPEEFTILGSFSRFVAQSATNDAGSGRS